MIACDRGFVVKRWAILLVPILSPGRGYPGPIAVDDEQVATLTLFDVCDESRCCDSSLSEHIRTGAHGNGKHQKYRASHGWLLTTGSSQWRQRRNPLVSCLRKSLYKSRRFGTVAMRTGRPKTLLTLTEDERRTLEQWARRPKTAQRLALRSRVVLACADGLPNGTVAARLHVSSNSVGKWRERFCVRRLEGLVDEPRPGAPCTVTDAMVVDFITRTLEGPPSHAT